VFTDRNSTVSQRSKLKSRTALIGEHPNPLDLVQPKDAMIQHRGAKHECRYELSIRISLFKYVKLKINLKFRLCHLLNLMFVHNYIRLY